MTFIPSSGVSDEDLQTLADMLAATLPGHPDGLEEHVNSLGLQVYSLTDLMDDLEEGSYIASCEDCGGWEYPHNLNLGLCIICEEDLHDELEDDEDDFEDEDDFDDDLEDEDEDDDFGFGDDVFDELDDIVDDTDNRGLYIFDETEDDEDDL
jgi:hypothetical protein